MEKSSGLTVKRSAIKLAVVAAISLLLLIPLSMIKGVIGDREWSKQQVTQEVAETFAGKQVVYTPQIESTVTTFERDSKGKVSHRDLSYIEHPSEFDIRADVTTELLHRSIYDVIVYGSKIEFTGDILITETILRAKTNNFKFKISDFKGLDSFSELRFGDKSYSLDGGFDYLSAMVELPQGAKLGDRVEFGLTVELKGTESLSFQPMAKQTTLTMTSRYPHPSFYGGFLPDHRRVSSDGFKAEWSVLSYNVASQADTMGVKFVDPANPYQQAMRSVKYGMLIVVLVFVAALLVELATRRQINPVQYAIIGLSLVLFYSLLVAFSEFITFGLAYIIAATMTVVALMLYFRAILKSRSAYLLGGFVAVVYLLNYLLLQMETYALLSGSLLLFLMLCVVMYLTANINDEKVS